MQDSAPRSVPAIEPRASRVQAVLSTRWSLFVLSLTVLSLFTALHLWMLYRLRAPIGWQEAVLSGFATWSPWLVLGPGLFWLSQRFPVEPSRWVLSLAVHAPAGVVFAVLHGLLRSTISPWVDPEPVPVTRIIVGEMLLMYMAYLAFVAVDQAVQNYRRFSERELRASQLESKLAQAQLEVLRMQLHPHFLFNTLHAISTLIHRDPEAADDMLTQLSDLLRMTLDNIGVQEVSLREELEFLRRYLDIQQMRFQDRLRVTIDAPSDTLDARVPNQALQPIVENAIRHGLDGRAGGGAIEIRARGTDSMLQVSVRDDGPGLRADGRPANPDGIGLANTRARLQQLYGPLATLDLTNHARGGMVVTLLIPQERPLGAHDSAHGALP
jgi:two-component system, LytTR family, sensor kinase